MKNPLISVIVPVYNAEIYLKKCIDSILNQTYLNLEILLIDDGSTDGSVTICDNYQKKDSRVYVFHKENGGPASARNYGLNRVKGEYITFVDSDDWIEPEMYEVLISNAQKFSKLITGCATMTNFEDGTSKNTFDGLNDIILNGETCIFDILYQTCHAWGAMYNKIYRKEVFDKVRFPNINHLEDYVVSLQLYNEVDSIYFCSKPMYHYFYRKGSLSKKEFYSNKIKVIDTAQQIKEYFIKCGANKKILGGAYSFLWRMYCDVFWEIYKYNVENGKKLINERKKAGLKAFQIYICNSRIYGGDLKRMIKFFLAVIWAN